MTSRNLASKVGVAPSGLSHSQSAVIKSHLPRTLAFELVEDTFLPS